MTTSTDPVSRHLPSLEAWTLATALLSNTERLRVGHLVLCNQFRHPVLLAKMATTLDQISGGRLQLGIGSGSIEAEHQQAGLEWGSFAERSARLGETLEILDQAFDAGSIDFHGAHYTVSGMPISPGPVQQPRPPIIVGGVGEKYTLPLVARYADVWNVPTYALGELEHKLSVLRAICDDIGRDPATIVMSVEAVMALAPDDAALPKVRRWPKGVSVGRVSACTTVAWSALRPRSSTDCTNCRNSASGRWCCSPTTARQTTPSSCWPPRSSRSSDVTRRTVRSPVSGTDREPPARAPGCHPAPPPGPR